MRGLERLFFAGAIVLGLAGMLLGLHMGIDEDFTLVPVHTHLNLVGWVSLAVFGLAYRTGIAKADRWGMVHFWVALAAGVLFPIGIYVSITHRNPSLAIFGALLALTSMVLFLINFIRARG